ncbi:MAG: hypothetical protein IKV82_02150 [Akkermansia sp.]|nr:hypothetical protein [Akkermansia sp.]
MLKTFLTSIVLTGCLCSPLMALSVVDSTTGDKQITITFDESLPGDAAALQSFEVADKRYGRFTPATATINGNTVTLSYESYATAAEQKANVVWRYTGSTPVQSYTGSIEFKAVPLGQYPAVGKVVIACVGDSITFGYGIRDTQKRYPETLGRLLGERFQVGRFGNSGKTAGKCQPGRWYGEQVEYTQALDFKADVYICNLGINDTSNSWWNPKASEEDFATLIEAFQGPQKATVVLWGKLGPDFRGPPGKKTYPGNVFKGYNFSTRDNGSAANRPAMEKIIAKLARKYNCPTMDAYTAMAKEPELYKVDGLHPTPEGAAKLALITYDWLAKPYHLKSKK